MERVSFVIPTYKGVHLPEVLHALSLQTRPADEVVIVVDGETMPFSTEHTVITIPHSGACTARNTGFTNTTGDFVVKPADAVDSLDGDWQADLVLFCVKSYQNEVAINQMKPAVGPNTMILTLQNGLGSADELSAVFGQDSVMLGAAYVEAERLRPGVFAEHGGTCRLVFGERDGSQ